MYEFETDDEIFEFAIAREIEAYQLFTALAEKVQNPAIRIVFQELAAEELEHKERLELEVMKTGKVIDTTKEPPAPKTNNYEQFIVEDDTGAEMNYGDILQMGIEKETASIKIFNELATIVRNKNLRDILLALVEEEMRHKIRLENTYENLISHLKGD